MRVPSATAFAIALLTAARLASAGATSPKLAIAAASATAVEGARAAVFDGAFDFANALQLGYPLHLVVFQGTRFARYPVAAPAVDGSSPELADGVLAAGEVPAFLLEGSPSAAGVGIVTLTATQIRVTLPAGFVPGPASAIAVAVLAEGISFSNPITFTLP